MAEHPAEILKRIESLGGIRLDRHEQREMLLSRGLGANVDKEAEYVIQTGCYAPFSITPVKSLIELMHYFGVSYTFLSREDCCGKSIVEGMFREGLKDDGQSPDYEAYSRQSLSNKLTQAKDLGATAMVTICPGCNTIGNRYNEGRELAILHYLDLVLKVFDGSRLPLEVDFYEGCHRWHRFASDFQESMIENSKKVMARVEGLVYKEIPSKICCRFGAAKIFAASQTGIIVTPNVCCYGFLTKSRATDSPKVKFLAEILCESLSSKGH